MDHYQRQTTPVNRFQPQPPFANGQRYGQRAAPSRDPAGATIDFKTITYWATSIHPGELVIIMYTKLGNLKQLLARENLPVDWIHFLSLSFQKVIRDNTSEGLVYSIIEVVAHSNFLDIYIPYFLSNVRDNPHIMSMLYASMRAFFDILDFVVLRFSDCLRKTYFCVCKIEESGEQLSILNVGSDLRNQCVQLKLKACPAPVLQDYAYHSQSQDRETFRRGKVVAMNDEEPPPDDFTEKSIFPDIEELEASVAPFLRANKTTGPYRSLKHYTDVHFRLLREDYLSPIRDGLKVYKQMVETGKEMVSHDLRFYYNVKIVRMKVDDTNGIRFFVKFDPKVLQVTEWEFAKRFMFGALLCFSKDNYETIIFATVAHRDLLKLEKGLVEVCFQTNLEDILTSSENDTFGIAESVAFFESYKHVLEGLQEVEELPLDKYILNCWPNPDPPKYLSTRTTYDIGCIMKQEEERFVTNLDPATWPDFESTILNANQYESVKLALTNEIAIIQGPPGTGKTYVGEHIMQILLKNRAKTGEKDCPILVVCYTNHALDQFLEGMLEFCGGGIIRIGGQSKSELLEDFNLRKLRDNPIMDKRLNNSIKFDLSECRKRLKRISYFIRRYWKESLNLDACIQSVSDLEEELTSAQIVSLRDPSRGVTEGKEINIWLKASNANVENHLIKAAERHLTKLILLDGENLMEDTILLDSSQRLNFRCRVRVYQGWIAEYKDYYKGNSEAIEKAEKDILPDEELFPYMSSEEVYERINRTVEQECKEHQPSASVRSWLLGFFQNVDQILNEIGKLSNIKTESDLKKNQSDRSRVVVVNDSDDDDGGGYDDSGMKGFYDGNDDDENNDTESSASSETNKRVNDFKDLVINFNESERREVELLQRAKMLEIDINEEQEEEFEERQGWQVPNQMTYGKVFALIKNAKQMSEEEAKSIDDVWSLSLQKRYSLYKTCVMVKKAKLAKDIVELTRTYNEFLKLQKKARSKKDIAILKQGQVIGLTTTGAARFRSVLQEVKPRIIIVEEAAEVLEAHIVTTLNKHCQHLILIGDHQQLRPNPTVHRLAVDYNLEISLFERLINNKVRAVTLNVQHRMRPEISKNMLYIYPKLRDHPSVTCYENVKGMGSNVFFLYHKFRETNILDSTSKANTHEAEFLTKLCKYFLQQGYTESQITILAAYTGQVNCLRECMKQEEAWEERFKHVRVTSIDNYQGEENDIVLLSLVRSNLEEQVGFLKTSNRICVAMSRAKVGLYVIGNLPQLENSSKLWKNILKKAREKSEYGVFLTLVCRNHNQHQTYIQHAGDFISKVPEGGCDRYCGVELPCGHKCPRKCHIADSDHIESLCDQPCLQACPDGHPCMKSCSEDCGNCEMLVTKEMPMCGHKDLVPCYMDAIEACCGERCNQVLACGHSCKGFCGQCLSRGHRYCEELVEKVWSPCGDKNMVPCFTDVKITPCPAKCREKLKCGDICKGTCGECLSRRVHKPCQTKCKKALPCGHQCQSKCSMPCEPCKMRCLSMCRHASCSKTFCGESCDMCKENCALVCKHQPCSERCCDDCSQQPCKLMCKEILTCKHKCSSICGEYCVCFTCDEKQFGLIDFSKSKPGKIVMAELGRSRKFQPDKDTTFMKIPKCGHVFTLKQLDKHVEKFDPDGTTYIRCPRCPSTLQGIVRYDRLNKSRANMRENRKYQLEQCSTQSQDVVEKLQYSLAIINNFCPFDLDNYLEHQDEQIRGSHANALRLLSRYSFGLYLVIEIHKEFNPTMSFNADKWKNTMKSNQRGITPQFEEEMKMELYRLLILEQLVAVKGFLDDSAVTLPEPLKNQFKHVMKNEITHQLTLPKKKELEVLISKLFVELSSSQHSSTKQRQAADHLTAKVDLATSILHQPKNLELSAILEAKNILPAPVGESSSDEDEDDEDEEEGNEVGES